MKRKSYFHKVKFLFVLALTAMLYSCDGVVFNCGSFPFAKCEQTAEPIIVTVVPEEPIEVPDEEPIEVPDEEPIEVPDEEPIEVPDEEPIEVPDEEPIEVPDEEPIEVPDEEPIEVPDEEPIEVPNEPQEPSAGNIPPMIPDETPEPSEPVQEPIRPIPEPPISEPPDAPPTVPTQPTEPNLPTVPISGVDNCTWEPDMLSNGPVGSLCGCYTDWDGITGNMIVIRPGVCGVPGNYN